MECAYYLASLNAIAMKVTHPTSDVRGVATEDKIARRWCLGIGRLQFADRVLIHVGPERFWTAPTFIRSESTTA
jgi:hypothetical protein